MISSARIGFFDRPEDGRSRAFSRDAIRAGKIVYGPRSCGKTQALLEVIHEDLKGVAVVICASSIECRVYRARYRDMFPRDRAPRFVSGKNPFNVEGVRNVLVDGFERMPRRTRDLLSVLPEGVRGTE